MQTSLRGATSSIVVAILLAAMASPAAANSYSVRDRRDIRNSDALDIVSTRIGHKGGRLLHAVTLERSISPRVLDRIGFIDFLISTDSDFDDFERRIYILGGSRFRVYVTNGTGRRLIGRGDVYHPNARTLGAVVSPNVLGGPDGYYWFAVAVTDGPGDCCVDVAPQRNWYIHDLTSPVVEDITFGNTPLSTVPSATVPITWSATDSGFGGLSYWTLRQRLDGAPAWSDVQSGGFGFDPRVFETIETTDFAASEGSTYEACVSLADWAGNRATSGPYSFSVPYDDANASVFQYSGTDWSATTVPSNFNGTEHATSVDGASVTITVPAGLEGFLVVRGGYTGYVTVTVNGTPAPTISLIDVPADFARARLSVSGDFHAPGGADDVIVLTKAGGDVFAIDGYLGAPPYTGGAAYDGCGGPPTLPAIATMARAVAVAPLSAEVISDALVSPASSRG